MNSSFINGKITPSYFKVFPFGLYIEINKRKYVYVVTIGYSCIRIFVTITNQC